MATGFQFLSKILGSSSERKLRDFRDLYLRKYKFEKLPDEIFDPALPRISISFCTTCMNRLFHLKKTIEQNILDNLDYPEVEFVLIDYNSQDGLRDWVKKELSGYIDRGLLNYYFTNQPKFFHASKAKNLAHKVAKGEIVCNLDGDNFTGKNFAFYINYMVFKYGRDSLFHFRKPPFWGTEGRIALLKEKFEALGGYDENLLPTGHEDYDFINRARAFGLEYHNIQIENFLRYLSNTTKEKSSNFEDENAYYYDYESRNRIQSNANIKNNILVSNPEGWGKLEMEKNFKDYL